MFRGAARIGKWMWTLALCGIGATAPTAVIAAPLQADRHDRAAAFIQVAVDGAGVTMSMADIAALTEPDGLTRHQSTERFSAPGHSSLQGAFLSGSAQRVDRAPPEAAASPVVAQRSASELKLLSAEDTSSEATDLVVSDSKLAALVATIVFSFMLLALLLLGLRLRGHKRSHQSAHRFIAYTYDQ